MQGQARRPQRLGGGEREEEEREAPTPTLGGETASATPQLAPHSFTDSDKEEAPPRPPRGSRPQPQGATGGGGPAQGRGRKLGAHIQLPSAHGVPLPSEGGGRVRVGGGMEGRGRRGHSRLERVLNGGGHGPLGWAASGPGRRCRRARAQPGLRRPLCRPARYDFIHSWGCGASGAGRAGGGARPIPSPPGARRDVESRGARRRPRAPLSGLHVPGGVGRTARPLATGDTGRGWDRSVSSEAGSEAPAALSATAGLAARACCTRGLASTSVSENIPCSRGTRRL